LPNTPDLRLNRDPEMGTPRFVGRRSAFLSPRAPGATAEEIVTRLLDANGRKFTLHHSDILDPANGRKVRDCVTKHNGMRSLTWQQQHGGIDIYGARFAMNLTADGRIVNVSSRALHIACLRFHDVVKVTAEEARRTVLRAVLRQCGGRDERTSSEAPELSPELPLDCLKDGPEHRPTQAIWYPLDMISVVKAWDLIVDTQHSPRETHRFIVRADTGEIVEDINLTWGAAEPATFHVYTSDSPEPLTPGPDAPTNVVPVEVARETVVLTALDTNASPSGWIPAGGNELVGNNAEVRLDRNDDDLPDGGNVAGSPHRTFDFPLDLNHEPETYADAARVQAFYWINWFHDRLYGFGFDETAGNFQRENFGRGGRGGDRTQVDVQNGSTFGEYNQANITVFGDGSPPLLQLHLWTRMLGAGPKRDSALDAEVILHEAAHGVSSRLIGDGFGLNGTQPRGMGEGWSDFMALSLLSEATDDPHACYPFGNYVGRWATSPTSGYYGIRRFPYCTDTNKAPQTFADTDPNQIAFPSEVPMNPTLFQNLEADQIHRVGEVWCLALWECRANLIDRYGSDGNETMLQLVVDGMKLTPENPTFVEARDAIFQADLVNGGGTNQLALWRGFAKRGLGYGASVPSASSTAGIVESFELPFDVAPRVAESAGDGDGCVEPGESGELMVVLTSHEMTLSNVTATLTVISSNVLIVSSNAVIPDVPSGGSVTSSPAFRFAVDAAFPGFADAVFALRIGSDRGWFEQPLSVRIGNPIDYPPEIMDVTVTNLTENGATIAWHTGIPATGQVEYGLTTDYTGGTEEGEAGIGTSHAATLTGLTRGTIYHYRIRALGTNGLESVSGDFQFRTPSRVYVYADSTAAEELGTREAPFKSLQAAAEAAKHTGDPILVAMGTYTSNTDEAVLELGGSDWDLTIEGGYAPDFSSQDPQVFVTRLDGQRERRGIWLDNGATLTVRGITIARGEHQHGGGMGVRRSACRLDRCRFSGNTSTAGINEYGAGLYAALASRVTLVDCTLSQNRTKSGGGLYAVSPDTEISLNRCLVEHNTAHYRGGSLELAGGAQAFLRDVVIFHNVSGSAGGGVVLLPFSRGTFETCTIVGNTVTNATSPVYDGGGGILVAGSSSTATLWMDNCIVSGNASVFGDDLRCAPLAQVHAEHCNIGNTYGALATSNHVTSVDPLLVRGGVGDFHLLHGSPCIDAGDPHYDSGGTDMDGEPRPFGARVDIGADEFTDADGDRMADYWEKRELGSAGASDGTDDGDGDSLVTFDEYMHQTDPERRDTDGDLADDGWEVAHAFDPLDRDMDNDGMWDGWEAVHGLNAFTNSDASVDWDGDLMDNLAEFTADTDPTNAASVLRVLEIGELWGGTRIDWQGGVNAWQFLEAGDSLTDADGWETVVVFPPPRPVTNAVVVWEEPQMDTDAHGSRKRFYRVRVER